MDPMMLYALLFAAAFASDGHYEQATGIRYEHLPCPHGEGSVRKYTKLTSNTMGGYDSDLAMYSSRAQFREYAISTCPSSYFSALGTDLGRPIPEVYRSSIDDAIAQSRSEWADAENPEVWERYDTAARIATVLGRDPIEVAELYLAASWTARDAAVGIYVGGLNGPKAAREILDLGEQELAKALPADSLKILRYNLARVAHRGGFNADRDRHLEAYAKLGNLTAAEAAAGRRMRHIAKVVEPRYQRAAVMGLQAAVQNRPTGFRSARARYQLADLHRRLGDREQAVAGFKQTIADDDAPAELKQTAGYLLEVLGQ